MYDELKLDLILNTLAALRSRVEERFPASGLVAVTDELLRIGRDTGPFIARLRRPNRLFRSAITAAVVLLLAVPVALLVQSWDGLAERLRAENPLELMESAIQDLIFLSLAVYFLLTLEGRLARRTALRELHRLRTIVHIVDMHQLTKDPEHLLSPGDTTRSSPERKFTRFELARYLDYCSELLSISSKLAALHVQYVSDPVVLEAVSDIENLASQLSSKIWQKIMILDTAASMTTS